MHASMTANYIRARLSDPLFVESTVADPPDGVHRSVAESMCPDSVLDSEKEMYFCHEGERNQRWETPATQ
jgi:hypothetical protein